MHVSQPTNDDFAGIDDIGDKFYRNMDRIAGQIGSDNKPYF